MQSDDLASFLLFGIRPSPYHATRIVIGAAAATWSDCRLTRVHIACPPATSATFRHRRPVGGRNQPYIPAVRAGTTFEVGDSRVYVLLASMLAR